MRVVADTSAWVASMNGDDADWLGTKLEDNEYVFATDVVCAELLAARRSRRQHRLVARLATHRRIINLGGMPDMRRAAECMRTSSEAGRTVRSMADCLIAAVCIREHVPLLHNDRDFDTLAELTSLQAIRF
ncbi:MAG: PilT protein domain protein [Thermoleophilia bacterium]|nr:PilT protein domain protein [Thermoleophilia bacterium]